MNLFSADPIKAPWKKYAYYRATLTDEKEREAYAILTDGISKWQKSIVIPFPLKRESLSQVKISVFYDTPLFFHIGHSFSWSAYSDHIVFFPKYIMSKEEYEKNLKEVIAFVNAVKEKVKGMSALEIIKNIYYSFSVYVRYGNTKAKNAHNILGVIIDRDCVCESMAQCFKLLCDVCEIPSMVALGNAGEKFDTEPDCCSSNHAWNCVMIEHNWYNLDVTWDLEKSFFRGEKVPGFFYFCRSDQVFSRDHRPTPQKPSCPNDIDYYKITGNYARNAAEFRQIAEQAIQKKMPFLIIEIEKNSGMDPNALWKYMPEQRLYHYSGSIFVNKTDEEFSAAWIKLSYQ